MDLKLLEVSKMVHDDIQNVLPLLVIFCDFVPKKETSEKYTAVTIAIN